MNIDAIDLFSQNLGIWIDQEKELLLMFWYLNHLK